MQAGCRRRWRSCSPAAPRSAATTPSSTGTLDAGLERQRRRRDPHARGEQPAAGQGPALLPRARHAASASAAATTRARRRGWRREAAHRGSSSDGCAELASLVRSASSYVLNDKLRVYEGHDYENVMLLTYMALNQLAARRLRQRARRDQADARARGADRRAARARQLARGRGRGEEARRAHQLQGAERLSGRDASTTRRSTRSRTATRARSRTTSRASSTRRWASRASPRRATAWRTSCSPNQPLLEEALRGLDARVRARRTTA